MHGGDLVSQVLLNRGVRHLFTLCGGHISPILTGAKERGINIIDVRDEATAVFAADASARLSGIPGVAAVTAGPGLTNTITAVKNAQLAQSPIVILGGAAPTVLKGRGALQDIDQMKLMRPHVKYAKTVRRVRDLGPVLEHAFSISQQGVPGPVFVECPIDLLYDESVIRGWYGQATPSGRSLAARLQRTYLNYHLNRQFAAGVTQPSKQGLATPAQQVPGSLLAKVAAAVEVAQRPVLVIGSQAMLQAAEVQSLANAVASLGIPVYLSGMARGLLGRKHALHLRHKRRLALRESDCVLLAGVPCDFRLDYGSHIPRRATYISINRSRHDMTMNRKPTIGVLSDAGHFLRSLGSACKADCREWLETLRARDDEREDEITAEADTETEHINPLRLLKEIDAVMDDDSLIVADGGDFVATASYTVRPRGPLSWLDPGAFGTLGVGAGFAMGAKLHRPNSETWVIYGDGAFGYSLIEFESFVRLKIPVIAVIGNDASWSQIAREQVKLLQDDVGTTLRHSDYHLAAESFGARGFLLDTPDKTREVLLQAKQAASAGQPVLINAILGHSNFREGSISM
ncbi:MAG: thiamine pyrophosphate-binding protein [Proteobacteria bacterium]|nr:thiamine pyrophosphate-binding protein [Pseudomonadota bacterium]